MVEYLPVGAGTDIWGGCILAAGAAGLLPPGLGVSHAGHTLASSLLFIIHVGQSQVPDDFLNKFDKEFSVATGAINGVLIRGRAA